MSDVTTDSPEVQKALRNQAVVDFVAVVGTTVEAGDDGVDMAEWISSQTEFWTRDHARAGVLVAGMMLAAGELPTEVLADIGRALIVE